MTRHYHYGGFSVSYDFQTFYVTSWGWEGQNRKWRVYVDTDGEEDLLVGEFVGEGRGLGAERACEIGLEMIAAKMS